MEKSFWDERWQSGQIGFHQGRPHEMLVKHHDVIADARRVYVPLCGKAKDLAWLRDQGHDVTGSELVADAVGQLMREEELVPTTTVRGAFRLHITPRLTVLEGDALAIDEEVAGVFDAIYDRAALVALDPKMRVAYVDSLMRVLRPGGRILLITFVYDQTKVDGPPFSVPESDVWALFGKHGTLTKIDEREDTINARFAAAGISDLREAVFVVERG